MHVPGVRDFFFFMVDLLVSLNTWRIDVGFQQAPGIPDPHLTLVHACSSSPWPLLRPQVAPMDLGGVFWHQASGGLLRIQPSAHPGTCTLQWPQAAPVAPDTQWIPAHPGSQVTLVPASSCGPWQLPCHQNPSIFQHQPAPVALGSSCVPRWVPVSPGSWAVLAPGPSHRISLVYPCARFAHLLIQAPDLPALGLQQKLPTLTPPDGPPRIWTGWVVKGFVYHASLWRLEELFTSSNVQTPMQGHKDHE